jgi:hypothetical protein
MRNEKVIGPQCKGGQELKKKKPQTLPKSVHEHKTNSFYVSLLLLLFENDL